MGGGSTGEADGLLNLSDLAVQIQGIKLGGFGLMGLFHW